jgi:hypothetical protein
LPYCSFSEKKSSGYLQFPQSSAKNGLLWLRRHELIQFSEGQDAILRAYKDALADFYEFDMAIVRFSFLTGRRTFIQPKYSQIFSNIFLTDGLSAV